MGKFHLHVQEFYTLNCLKSPRTSIIKSPRTFLLCLGRIKTARHPNSFLLQPCKCSEKHKKTCLFSNPRARLVVISSSMLLHFNSLNRILIKRLLLSSSTQTDYPLHPLKHFIKNVHSFRRSIPKTPTDRFSRFPNNRSTKSRPDKNQPKLYMRNIISTIYSILKYSSWDAAQEQLSRLNIKWDSYTINQVLKTHPPMQKAWIFFNWASSLRGFKHDQYTYTTMLDIFGEAGRLSSMHHVFQQMQEKGVRIDAVTYTSIMHWVSRNGDVDAAVKIWEEMKDKRCCPTVVSYTAYMKILFENRRVQEASDVYREMLEADIPPNCHTYTVLMEHLVLNGKYQEALHIFGKMQDVGEEPDKAACNILVERCCEAGEVNAMNHILQYMRQKRLVLRYPVFMKSLKTLNDAGESDTMLKLVNPHCVDECINDVNASEFITIAGDSYFDRGLVMLLLEKQNLVAVDRLLIAMIDKNNVFDCRTASTIIKVNCDRCRVDGALLAFECSMKMSIDLERAAYLSLLGMLIRLNMVPKVVEIIEEVIRNGHSLGIYLSALLIYRMGHARRPTFAFNIFSLLPADEKCTATYTALISAYFTVGSADKGLQIYRLMTEKRIRPSLGTYNVLLAGLEGTGRVSELQTFRKEKKILLSNISNQSCAPLGERICDLLFSGGLTYC